MFIRLSGRNAAAVTALFLMACPASAQTGDAPETERIYLSGKGPKDARPWGFTVTGGRRAGEKTTIPVPSNWEQHGFGTYSYGDQGSGRSDERGFYTLRFTPPAGLKGKRVRLVFEGVMTDAAVKVNGIAAGPVHQGGFYRFKYDVTAMLKPGEENLVEVEVSKASADLLTDRAERAADYWVFGGIFRPVWLEVSPVEAIDHVAIDARADGSFTADVRIAGDKVATRVEAQIVDSSGKPVGSSFSRAVPAGGAGKLRIASRVEAPRLWTAETPNLYSLRLTLFKGDEAVHASTERSGFRTFELRPGDGLYLNGQRILLKGVNRHSFRPETARALNDEDNWADVRLIKSMNMNAVRMSHYPPDPALLEAADELGLYVLDELSGWQKAHGTAIGRQLVREMVERDVNHPSILFWDNGNEGGFNRDLDGDFALHDPQNRRVLHPWELHDDLDTKHYSNYADLTRRLAGKNLLMPTEILHALYDGGAGAGLDDYWKALSASPVGAGMFIWAFADEGIARTDRNGSIDSFSTYAPDGIVGPNHEKEGSYFAVRDLWSPVQIEAPATGPDFDGTLNIRNGYDFTSLTEVRFAWKLVRFSGMNDKGTAPIVLAKGETAGPAIAPHGQGALKLDLPKDRRRADALMLTATGTDNRDIWTWSWPLAPAMLPLVASSGSPVVATGQSEIALSVNGVKAEFDSATGLLRRIGRNGKTLDLADGPRLVFARPRTGEPQWQLLEGDAGSAFRRLKTPQMADVIEIDLAIEKTDSYAGFKLEITPDGRSWKTIYDSTRRAGDGNRYIFAPQMVAALRYSAPTSQTGRIVPLKSLRIGFEADRFAAPRAEKPVITTGESRDPATGTREAWLESRGGGGLDALRWTLRADGSLKLDYSYALSGDYLYHGITFDHPEDRILSVRSLGKGPYRVWQNRLRGAELGVREAGNAVDRPGADTYPEFQGYFSGLRWARFNSTAGPWAVSTSAPDLYLRVGTPQLGHINTSAEFPAGDLSFLHAIPAIGSKFVVPADTGPASQPARAAGIYSGSLVFSLQR
ncbi:glycoside hydrolase family 2 TIM barrel-domain containing protein [Sphingomonas sp. DG1-23]|uniref:glycoside hydrolase family 2 protein n=1 Tax=Sphingomonas sp. DG1-23 TaxID=3068316 RepID=UPI00273D8237|nr:glycoside hydrolase family 2 TIM barrel-domain containing protein [Sphingomonas sp. DG1-23]MDP5280231.1 glycoside hydrolase family 2 TIM barrel-domain containing protein [Sphingomonas sp. DG1-23]